MTLYHYTCSHGAEGIRRTGVVKPNPATAMAWFTDLNPPVRDALGLTSVTLTCDRMEHRFTVADESGIQPYWLVRRYLPREWRDGLERAPGALLMHWWVSLHDVAVQL